jgi:hypothetical protein
MANDEQVVTLEQVRVLERRATEVETQIVSLAAEEKQLARDIAEAIAAGKDAKPAQQRRAAIRAERADLSAASTLLRERLATSREAACRAVAEKRLVGIQRAFGSIRSELEVDDQRLEEAARAYAEAASRLVNRWRDLNSLRREAGALADRFGLAAPELPSVGVLGRRPAVGAAIQTVAHAVFPDADYRPVGVEQCEHGIRQRRTYAEVSGAPGFEIITTAGLKPFPPLNQKQRAIVAAREQEAASEREATAEVAQEAAARASLPIGKGGLR